MKLHISNKGASTGVCGSTRSVKEIGAEKFVTASDTKCRKCLKIGVTEFSWRLVTVSRLGHTARELTPSETRTLAENLTTNESKR